MVHKSIYKITECAQQPVCNQGCPDQSACHGNFHLVVSILIGNVVLFHCVWYNLVSLGEQSETL